MITEDYVSYEIAKLLKEKGFDESVNRFYEISTGKPSLVRSEYCRNSFTIDYAAPTHQMALKWLREVHNICIVIRPYVMEDGICYCYETKKLHTDMVESIKNQAGYTIYEEAVEAALKYTLENLI